ncbi:MAG: tetratricopeptide repeat protein [Bacteroidota bacterium]
MNKQKFLKAAEQYNAISSSDLGKLEELAVEYPYSQIIHALVAKGNYDNKTPETKSKLNYAAMYSTDRKVLKHLIDNLLPHSFDTQTEPEEPEVETGNDTVVSDQEEILNQEEVKDQEEAQATPEETIDQPVEETKVAHEYIDNSKVEISKEPPGHFEVKEPSHSEADRLRKEVFKNLQQLKESLHSKDSPHNKIYTEYHQSPQNPTNTVESKEAVLDASTELTVVENVDQYIEELKEKEEISQEDDKRKEQNELIDKFINEEPQLKRRFEKQPEDESEIKEDLSLESVEFNEEFITENLALIFIKQGKKEKAIDIYKKLIWKFPQKKAYFADQIEKLKYN